MPRNVIEIAGLDHGSTPIPLAVEKDGLLVTGGINGIDPTTGKRPDDLDAEIAQVYSNIRAIVDAAGFTLADIMKITFFVADRSIRSNLNPGWLELFPDPRDRPARHTLVQSLTAGVRLQAEMLAFRSPEVAR